MVSPWKKGLKLAQDKGLGKVTAADLGEVRVAGSLEVLEDGAWQPARQGTLALRAQDSDLSLSLLQDVRAYLHQKGFSATAVDVKVPRMRCYLDLLGDCVLSSPLGTAGKLWVELKVCSQETLARTLT